MILNGLPHLKVDCKLPFLGSLNQCHLFLK